MSLRALRTRLRSLSKRAFPVCRYILRMPGLTGDGGSVSFESVDYPGFYMRHYGYELFLENINNSRNTDIFNEDATFNAHSNKYFQVSEPASTITATSTLR